MLSIKLDALNRACQINVGFSLRPCDQMRSGGGAVRPCLLLMSNELFADSTHRTTTATPLK